MAKFIFFCYQPKSTIIKTERPVGPIHQIMCDFYMYKEVKHQPKRLFTFLILFRTILSEDNIKMGL